MAVHRHDGFYLHATAIGHMVVKVPEEGVAVAGCDLVQEDNLLFGVVGAEATKPHGAQRDYRLTLEASVETFTTDDRQAQ